METQKALTARIEKEHPRKPGEDRLSKKILALMVELGELANEWRGFKFWSNDKNPRTLIHVPCELCYGTGFDRYENGMYDYDVPCPECHGKQVLVKYPLLEEYVDCLHFILDIWMERGFEGRTWNLSAVEGLKQSNITDQFSYLFSKIGDFNMIRNHNNYMYIVPLFIGLGEMLGFTWKEIEQAYYKKNEINFQRQDNSY